MPSILQGRDRKPKEPDAETPAMEAAEQPEQDAGQLVAAVYEKPDGTICTEGPDGVRVEHPDMMTALDHIMMSGGAMPEGGDMEAAAGDTDAAPVDY